MKSEWCRRRGIKLKAIRFILIDYFVQYVLKFMLHVTLRSARLEIQNPRVRFLRGRTVKPDEGGR
jgi:hypothetical protein